MTGPIEQMAGWQQVAICGGLFAVMVWLQMHPAKTRQPQRLPREYSPRRDRQDDFEGRN